MEQKVGCGLIPPASQISMELKEFCGVKGEISTGSQIMLDVWM